MDQIRTAGILKSLDEDVIDFLFSRAERKIFHCDDLILEKGKIHDFFAVLIRGRLDIFDKIDEKNYIVASLTASGEFLGGQSLLEKPATMNVKANGETECWVINLDLIRDFCHIKDALIVASAVDTSNKLEATNAALLRQLEKSSTASATILMCLSGFSLAMIFLSFMTSINYPTDGLWSWLFLLFVIPPPLAFVASTHQSIDVFGVTHNHFKKSLLDGLIGSAVVAVISFGIVYFFSDSIGVSPNNLFVGLNLGHFQTYLYFIHCYLQEFFVRGAIQTSLIEVIRSKWKITLSVTLASAIFSVLHYPFGFKFILATFFSGLLFGFVYCRTRNLIGVTLIHYVSGKLFFSLYHALS